MSAISRALFVVSLVACGSDPPELDAGVDGDAPVGCVIPVSPGPFGEQCTEAPFPNVTSCRDGRGWCVNGRCEVSCTGPNQCPGCPAGHDERVSDRGACFCAR